MRRPNVPWMSVARLLVPCTGHPGPSASWPMLRRIATPRLLRELGLLSVLYAVYAVGRMLAAQHTGAANTNAADVWAIERVMFLPNERSLQHWALAWPELIRAANSYYVMVHFPATIATFVWLYARRPAHYVWARNVIVTMTAAGLALHLAYPLTPPRLYSPLAMMDTGSRYGQSIYGPVGTGIADQLAAMPSLHVGWSVLVAIMVIAAGRHRLRWLVVLHPITTCAVVVVTANHYWLDGMVAIALLLGALLIWRRVRPRRAVGSPVWQRDVHARPARGAVLELPAALDATTVELDAGQPSNPVEPSVSSRRMSA